MNRTNEFTFVDSVFHASCNWICKSSRMHLQQIYAYYYYYYYYYYCYYYYYYCLTKA